MIFIYLIFSRIKKRKNSDKLLPDSGFTRSPDGRPIPYLGSIFRFGLMEYQLVDVEENIDLMAYDIHSGIEWIPSRVFVLPPKKPVADDVNDCVALYLLNENAAFIDTTNRRHPLLVCLPPSTR